MRADERGKGESLLVIKVQDTRNVVGTRENILLHDPGSESRPFVDGEKGKHGQHATNLVEDICFSPHSFPVDTYRLGAVATTRPTTASGSRPQGKTVPRAYIQRDRLTCVLKKKKNHFTSHLTRLLPISSKGGILRSGFGATPGSPSSSSSSSCAGRFRARIRSAE